MPSSPQSSPLRLAFRNSKAPKSRWKVWSKEGLLLVEEDEIRGHLNKLEIHKSVGPDGARTSAQGAGPCHCEVTLNYL